MARISHATIAEHLEAELRARDLFQVFLRRLGPCDLVHYAACGWTRGGRTFHVTGAAPTLALALAAMLAAADKAKRDESPPPPPPPKPRFQHVRVGADFDRHDYLMRQARRMAEVPTISDDDRAGDPDRRRTFHESCEGALVPDVQVSPAESIAGVPQDPAIAVIGSAGVLFDDEE